MKFLRDFIQATPLRERLFRRYYVGSVGTAFGYTMLVTAAAWQMATLTPAAWMVALVQTASTAPSLVFGLIAGSLADIVDRRRVLVGAQWLLLAAAAGLGILSIVGLTGPVILLFFVAIVGAGFAFYMPAYQASINDLVAREELPRAIGLGAAAFNVARAAGPALAGAVAAWLGSGSALIASAVFFVPMMFAIRAMPAPAARLGGVPETVLSGVRAGLRYARHSPPVRSLLLHNLNFSICASALWALMPVVARDQLGLGAGGYGLLFGTFGVGAVIAAFVIPQAMQRHPLNRVVSTAMLLWPAAVLIVAATNYLALSLLGVLVAGGAWVGTLASLGAGTQSTVPPWVRARAMSLNLLTVQASLAIGAAIWGAVASALGLQITLFVSAGLMLLLFVLGRRVHVSLGQEEDVTPWNQLPELVIAAEPTPDDGPVLVQREYRIDPRDRKEFLAAIHEVEATRRRNGATVWRVYRDLAEEGKYVERFIIASWAEYMRSRSRMTMADHEIQDRAAAFQRADVPIKVSRLIAVDSGDD